MKYTVIALVIFLFGLGAETPGQPLEGRYRVELRGGSWTGRSVSQGDEVNVGGVMGAWTWTHWMRETWAVEATFSGVFADIQSEINLANFGTNWVMVHSLMGGLRKDLSSGRARPYVATDFGFVLIYGLHTGFGSYPTGADIIPAVRLGGGLDLRLGDHWMLGVAGGYYGMRSFSEPIGGIDNYSGPELSVGASRLIGG